MTDALFGKDGARFGGTSDVAVDMVPAATVVLLRDTADGIETLVLLRNSKLAFAGGMWVFPGGRVDDDDRGGGADALEAARRAAVREAAEEAGLEVDAAALVPYSHWCPPAVASKRFATWFFLAPAPGGSVVVDDGEITDHIWVPPDQGLRLRDQGEIELAPPTWVTLYELSKFATVADALVAARDQEPEFFETRVAVAGDTIVAIWHGDAGYETADVDAPGARHRLDMAPTGWRYRRD
ncbi:MAG: NUDIX domain-containing protein [Acidimicrobiia bacterium]